MRNPEFLPIQSPILGITQDRVEAEIDFFNIFMTNATNRQIYLDGIRSRMEKLHNPILQRFLGSESLEKTSEGRPPITISGAEELTEGILRGFNVLPTEHSELPLEDVDIERSINYISEHITPQGLLDLRPYKALLDATDPAFSYWATVDETDAGLVRRSSNFANAALLITLPFYLRSNARNRTNTSSQRHI